MKVYPYFKAAMWFGSMWGLTLVAFLTGAFLQPDAYSVQATAILPIVLWVVGYAWILVTFGLLVIMGVQLFQQRRNRTQTAV